MAPSVFNLYVKYVTPSLREKYPGSCGKLLLTLASKSWRTDPIALFIKEKVAEYKMADKEGDIVEMFTKAKDLYNKENEIVEVNQEVNVKKTVKKTKPSSKGKAAEEEADMIDHELNMQFMWAMKQMMAH
jgi:outer membrane lipopolysaccharide assembly protein LptE/RlpB